MSLPLMLLRPQPGNDASAARARALGLEVVPLPLFEIVPIEQDGPPPGPFDAILLTSANGARLGGEALAHYPDLPLYAVGEATAQAIRELGREQGRELGNHTQGQRAIRIGGGDAASTIPLIVADGHRTLLHVCGEQTRDFDAMGLVVTRHVVYRSATRDMHPFSDVLATLPPSVIAVHSPRAGASLEALIPPPARRNHILLAISPAAAATAGTGWQQVHAAPTPDDSALLHLASTLCRSHP